MTEGVIPTRHEVIIIIIIIITIIIIIIIMAGEKLVMNYWD
jgi:hypothetical protein